MGTTFFGPPWTEVPNSFGTTFGPHGNTQATILNHKTVRNGTHLKCCHVVSSDTEKMNSTVPSTQREREEPLQISPQISVPSSPFSSRVSSVQNSSPSILSHVRNPLNPSFYFNLSSNLRTPVVFSPGTKSIRMASGRAIFQLLGRRFHSQSTVRRFSFLFLYSLPFSRS